MRVIPVADADAAELADFRDLTDVQLRRVMEPAGGLYLAESLKVLQRSLEAGHRPRAILALDRFLPEVESLVGDADVTVYAGGLDVLEGVTGFAMHRGVIASIHRPPLPGVAEVVAGARRVVVLEDLVDHTNVGAAFRAVAGLGADAVLVTPRCADPLYRRSVRVSMGTVLQVPWTRIEPWPDALGDLKTLGFEVAALALAEDAVSLEGYAAAAPERVALVLGTEGDGLSRRTLAAADAVVTIPMLRGVDSLNVASAAAVALWALRVPGR